MKKIEQKGFIQIGKDHKDKRKLLYRPADFMINYHQNPNRKVTKKYVDKSKDTGQNYPVLLGDTGQNYPVLLEEKNAQSHVPSSVAHDAKPPKGKGKVTSKAKVKPNSPNNNFLNREKHGQILTKRSFTFSHDDYDASKRQNFHLQPCFNKFIDHIKSKQGHDQFILPEWEAWRAKERGMNKNKRYGGSY